MQQLLPLDTTDDANRVQFRIWRRLGPQGRMAMAFELSDNVRRVLEAGIRKRHPEYTDEQVQRDAIRLTAGEELARRAFSDQEANQG